MKRFVFAKYHPCVQLAHLYEHLFVDAVSEALYQRKQYKFLDYAINGATYESGVIIISAEAYTAAAQQFLERLTTVKADLGKEASGYMPVARALSQLLAEESEALFVDDTEAIIHELRQLDGELWQNLDDLQQLPPQTLKQIEANDLIYAVNQPAKPPRKVVLQFIYEDYNPKLLPLWYQFAHFLSLSIGQRICHNFWAYFSQETIELKGKSAKLACTFLLNSQAQANASAKDILQAAQKILPEFTTDEIKKRFIAYLQSASYSDNPFAAPNEDQILRDTGILIGAAGWREIAAAQNIEHLLEKLKINAS